MKLRPCDNIMPLVLWLATSPLFPMRNPRKFREGSSCKNSYWILAEVGGKQLLQWKTSKILSANSPVDRAIQLPDVAHGPQLYHNYIGLNKILFQETYWKVTAELFSSFFIEETLKRTSLTSSPLVTTDTNKKLRPKKNTVELALYYFKMITLL